MSKPKILFIGDFACTTGFGTVNEALLRRVPQSECALYVLGINATGDPHPLQKDFMIYPSNLHGTDVFGVQRLVHIAKSIRPDLVIIHQDSWNIVSYLEAMKLGLGEANLPPVIAYCPPDAPNQHAGKTLTGEVDLLLCPTKFGVDEPRRGGYQGEAALLPYGVDPMFTPGDQREAREALGFKPEWLHDFIVGRADRNAWRKRYDLMLRYWLAWWRQAGEPADARLLLHCKRDDVGWNLDQLADWYGYPPERILFTDPDLDPRYLWPRERLPLVYRAWDVHFSTTMGEGAGLTAIESAMCGVPQVLPDYSAYGEIFRRMPGARLYACIDEVATMGGSINTIGGVPGQLFAIDALNLEYKRWKYRRLVRPVMDADYYNWDRIAGEFRGHIEATLQRTLKGSARA